MIYGRTPLLLTPTGPANVSTIDVIHNRGDVVTVY